MNPYSPPPCPPPNHSENSHHASLSAPVPPPPLVQTGHSSVNPQSCHYPASSDQNLFPDRSALPLPASPLPASDPGSAFRSSPSSASPNPYPPPATPPSYQVSVIVPSPDLRPSPLPSQCSEDCPDLECSVCFSQFNNVFRCPKMLQCKHTFCLECLARINVKSPDPDAIQCPLCRSLTPLPTLGLPRLATNADMLSYLPAAMQRVYSIRFQRSKGKLQVKRSSEGQRRWARRSTNRSLDVGLPSPPDGGGGGGEAGGVGGALFRLTGRPACRAFLLTSVVMMLLLLTAIVIFLLIFSNKPE